MKIGLAIAPEHALPTAFVVFRDRLEVSMLKASQLGYDGIELALRDASEVNASDLRKALQRYQLELPAISTGRVFAESGVWFTNPDPAIRSRAVSTVKGLIAFASEFGAKVNIGRARGFVHEGECREDAVERFLECMAACADDADRFGVGMVLEPVNRYETNFINSVPEALSVLETLARPNVRVMPDVFHMNIEDTSITGSLIEAGGMVGYVHLADSNRRAPGQGHLDFGGILGTLAEIGYGGYCTAEILPYPSPDEAAAAAVTYLRGVMLAAGLA